ncbi:hypothetical protein SDC9_173760 [bioreactor metagenome]|uniref:Uncharacterized protein n=1 Tax=bioreactor metagenome TaxID=1076179 RepID=A0A645GJB8_9ZZZZ
MGVAVNQFFADTVRHVVHGEAALLSLQLGVKHHLQQHVAQLLAQGRRVAPVDGLRSLAALLQKVSPEGSMILLTVPGTAAGRAKQLHDPKKVLISVSGLTLKIYHIFSAFAR